MRYFFTALMFLHGAIHLMGFVKAFHISNIEQLTLNISKISGLLWLICTILFLSAGIFYLANIRWWSVISIFAIILSTILIIIFWKDAKFGLIANIILVLFTLTGLSTYLYHRQYEKDVVANLSLTENIAESILTEADIENLPEPVKRYIRYSGAIGKPKVLNFRAELTGQIRQDENSEWMPFTTVQYNFIDLSNRLFFMDAVMKNLPVAGYHHFIKGKAVMDIRLFSLFRVQYQSGEAMDISETVTLFNDMCLLAPATLIDKRIRWLDAKEDRVRAEFSNNNITISATLFFNDSDQIINFISEDRYAAGEKRSMQRLPWSTPVIEYKTINGVSIASKAEAIYTYPAGDFCYGTFNISQLTYNCKELK